jgi:cellulose synthase operon protein C
MDPNEIETLVQRLVADPHDEEALAYAHQAGAADPKSYAVLLETVGNQTLDPAYASHWLSEAANVWLTTLGDAHRAARVLMSAIDKDPTQQVAAERLAQLYRDKGDAKALAALLERRAKALSPLIASTPELRGEIAGMHEEVGRLWSEPPLSTQTGGAIDPRKKALDNFRRALELDPSSAYAVFHAREAMKTMGMWEEAFGLYEMEFGLEQDPVRRLALLRDEAAARKLAGDLVGVTRTIARARQIDEQDPALQQELAASVLDRMQAGENVAESERSLAAELLVSLAEAYDGEHGLAYAAAALDIDGGHDRALQLYTYYARSLSKDEELSGRYLGYVEANPNGQMAHEARQVLADSYEAAGQVDNAIGMLEPLRNTGEPRDEATMSKLEELYSLSRSGKGGPSGMTSPPPTIQGRPPDDFTGSTGSGTNPPGTFGADTDSAPGMARVAGQGKLPPEKIQGILDAATMLAGKNKKPEALAKYKEVLDTDPAHPEALAWVEDYLRTKRDYAQLRDVLLASVRMMGSISEGMEGRKERLREVAGLCEGNLRDIDGAIGAWKQLLAIDRADESARQSLSRLLERTQRWDDLANLLEQEATVASEIDIKIGLEKKLATLNEQKRKDFGAAAEAWARIARLSPDDDRAIGTAARLFEKAGRLDAAAQVIADNAATVDDAVARGALLERLGEIREQVGDVGAAGEAFADAADAQKSARLWESAERCFNVAERWERAATAAVQRAQLAGDAKQQASHFARAADVLMRAGDETGALERLEQATDLDPTADDYASTLTDRYTSSEKWEKLVQFLSKRGDRLSDRAKRVILRREAATLYASKLGDKDAAREQWLKVLEDGDDREALEKLIDYAVEREDHTEAATLLRRLGGIAIDKADKARVALREAELLAEGVGDVDTAIVRYESILAELDATCRPALQAIADLQEARDNPSAAADALERELKLVADPQERGQIAARLARLYEQLDDPRAAIKALDIVRKADLEDFDALARLCELCERVEQWDRVAELLAQQIEVEGDEAEASRMTKKLAMILADELDRGDEALAALTELADQGDSELRQAYVELGDRLGWKGIVASKLVEWWFESKSGAERTAALRDAFDRFAEVGRDQDAARVAIEIVRARGADRNLAERLEQLALKTGDHDALSAAHEILARELQGAERADELVRQAERLVQAGIPREDAIQHGEAGLASVPISEAEPLLARLAELAEKSNDVVELYERQVSRSRAPADRMRSLARAAQVAAAKNQLERARGFFELALTGTPTDETLNVLEEYAGDGDRQSTQMGGGDKLRRALSTAMSGGGGGARDGGRTRSALLRRAATIAHRDLRDLDQAFNWLGDALIAHVDESALDAVEKLGVDLGDARRSEQTLTRALSEVFDGPLVRQLLARRAKIRREHINDKAGAAADLKKLHDLSPGDQAVLDELSALLRELGDYRGMVQLYEDQILRGKDMGTRAELARKVARMWEEQLQDPRETADAWRRVLRMLNGDAEAAEGLERAKSNMLKKPDPNADPDAYAPPKMTIPPSQPRPSAPPRQAVTNNPPSLDASPSTVEEPISGTGTGETGLPHTTTTITRSQSDIPFDRGSGPSTKPYPAEMGRREEGPIEDATAPHTISMELIATIRGTGKRGSSKPPLTASGHDADPKSTSEITEARLPREEDLARNSLAEITVSVPGEMFPDVEPVTEAANTLKGGEAAPDPGKTQADEERLGSTDERPVYDFLDETMARQYRPDELSASELEVDLSASELEVDFDDEDDILIADDIAEIVEDDETHADDPAKPPRSSPVPGS